jgi:flagellar motor protein MotB
VNGGWRRNSRLALVLFSAFAPPSVTQSQSAVQTPPDDAAEKQAIAERANLPLAPEPHIALPEAPDASADQKQTTPQNQQNQPSQQNAPNQQNSPGQSQQQPQQPSLNDLGFGQQQTQANPQLQAMLDRRTHMLKVHQKLGLFTLIPMAATVITGPMAKAKGKNGETIKEPSTANLDFHAALGGVTAGMYFTTAAYAIFAPKVPGTKKRGPIRFHEALAFIHGPGMILTPILGAIAYKQENDGEKAHGIASAHGTVAWVTVGAYGAAIVSVSWPLKF